MRFLALFLLATSLLPGEIPLSEYRERRAKLRKDIPDAIFLLAGNSERDVEEGRSGFFQESNFFYLTGWKEPGAVLVMTPNEETLFIPRRNSEAEKWTGRRAAPGDEKIQSLTGFASVLPVESLEKELPRFLESASQVYSIDGNTIAAKLKTALALR